MTEGDDKVVSQLFQKLDANHDGLLERKEFEKALTDLKLPLTDLDDMFKEMDRNKDKFISEQEFHFFVKERTTKLTSLFDELDRNHDGLVDQKEVEMALTNLKIPMVKKELSNLMERIDTNKDGVIDFEEFKNLLFLSSVDSLERVVNYWKEATLLNDAPDYMLPMYLTQGFNMYKSLLAGAISGLFSRTLTAPLERIKILYQVQTKTPPNLITGLKEMYIEGGFKGLFRGNGVNLIKVAPEKALKYAVYEQMKSFFVNNWNNGEKECDSKQLFVSGAVAGVTCHAVMHPFEVLKTRLSVAPTGQYTGMTNAFVTISKQEGYILPWFRGLTPAVLGTIPNSGVSLLSYELLKQMMFGVNPDSPPSIVGLMFCGSASSTFSQSLFYPLHVAQTRMIMQGGQQLKVTTKTVAQNVHGEVKIAKQYNGLIDAFVKIIQKEGLSAFYKGFGVNLIKSIPSHGITFGVYEGCKRLLKFEESHKKH
ncbi:hypothetical protein ABK040_014934 [Willaertia magna]